MKYFVDGFGYKGATLDREHGNNAMGLIKAAAGLEVDQRPQAPARHGQGVDGRPQARAARRHGRRHRRQYMRLIADFKKRASTRSTSSG